MSFERFHRSPRNLGVFQTLGYIARFWTFIGSLKSERFVRSNIGYIMIYDSYNKCFPNQRKKNFSKDEFTTQKRLIEYPRKLYIGYIQTTTLLLSRMFKSLLKTSISGGAILFIQTDQNGSGYVYWKYWGSKLQEYREIYRFVFTS